jgi:hypothetical protein
LGALKWYSELVEMFSKLGRPLRPAALTPESYPPVIASGEVPVIRGGITVFKGQQGNRNTIGGREVRPCRTVEKSGEQIDKKS